MWFTVISNRQIYFWTNTATLKFVTLGSREHFQTQFAKTVIKFQLLYAIRAYLPKRKFWRNIQFQLIRKKWRDAWVTISSLDGIDSLRLYCLSHTMVPKSTSGAQAASSPSSYIAKANTKKFIIHRQNGIGICFKATRVIHFRQSKLKITSKKL